MARIMMRSRRIVAPSTQMGHLSTLYHPQIVGKAPTRHWLVAHWHKHQFGVILGDLRHQ